MGKEGDDTGSGCRRGWEASEGKGEMVSRDENEDAMDEIYAEIERINGNT